MLFHHGWDSGRTTREARVAFADAASGKVGAAPAAEPAAAELRYAAVECDAVARSACGDFTGGGAHLPTVWCFAHGNWSEGTPLKLSIDAWQNATPGATLSTGALLGFATHCASRWAPHAERIAASRYVSSRARQEEELVRPGSRRDAPPSTVQQMRKSAADAPPKKAMEIEYVPHVRSPAAAPARAVP